MLVLAGPGSGKTAVITARTQNLIQKYHVNPGSILVITFTKAAANEMKQRFEKAMGEGYYPVTFGTFHAVFFKILKLAYGFETSNIIAEEDKYALMRQLIQKYHLEYRDEGECISSLLAEIGLVKNNKIPLEHYYATTCGADVFRKIYEAYQDSLHKKRLLDFDDMLLLTYELFQKRPDILKAWQNKYQYILVDEFQDINQIQYDIVRLLASPENNLFMVGDDDQSIYGFRGSKSEIMLHVPKDYPDLKQVNLGINYRCHKDIIEAAGRVIEHNENRYSKEIMADPKQKSKKGHVRFLEFEHQFQEIQYILKTIDNHVKEGGNLSDIAILFRTNTQPRFLMEQLMSYNVPFRAKDRIPNLYNHWIAKDLFTYIRIAQGSRQRADFINIMNKPKRYIGRDSLYGDLISFDEWEKMYEEQPWIAERIEKLAMDVRLLERMSPYAAINYIRHGIGYEDYLAEVAEYRGIDKSDLYDILDEIQAGAKGFSNYQAWELHIKECEEELKAMNKRQNSLENAITLATLHSSKGLEFQKVFLIDANEGIMPYKKSVLPQDIEEERRLFYVGMTRAISDLNICWVKNFNTKEAMVSRFVLEAKGDKSN
ncbi:MAG: ATP-dependent helicase [Agathobacter sp.]|nr:ATP-dependent helicase [Agathobacter sp.]